MVWLVLGGLVVVYQYLIQAGLFFTIPLCLSVALGLAEHPVLASV